VQRGVARVLSIAPLFSRSIFFRKEEKKSEKKSEKKKKKERKKEGKKKKIQS
jgi:hypothetical protein